jgi:tetratricopeptide (TPR) repeat protein
MLSPALKRLFLILIFAPLFQAPDPVFAQRSLTLPSPEDPQVLPPKLQKELGKAVEALRAAKPADARGHLEAVYRSAPNDADANFLFGIYSAQMNDWVNAKSYWEKVLAGAPGHLNALLSLGGAFLRENKPAEATQYFTRAVEAEPTSWRAYAVLADACLRRGLLAESIENAERALELGHSQAGIVQPVLARALYLHGDQERAVHVLQAYLQDHPADPAATKQLENVQAAPGLTAPPSSSPVLLSPSSELVVATSTLLPSNWLPPDIDERVPPVEPGFACNLEEVLQKAGKRIQEFVGNVDRYAATETVTHESINKWGFPSRPAKFEFEYLVSVKHNRLGLLTVDEYRDVHYLPAKFPDGIATSGLPALVLILHPSYVQNFAVTCEGLARFKGGPAWQLHLRQRPDKPNVIRTYKIGSEGPAFPVALKGRAWIAADSFQIVRLETDLIDPLPDIRLVADHAAIEYGPVHFQSRNLDMWLPQHAEIHYDWRGRRTHRRHSFRNYLLFSVDDNQRISAPKGATADDPEIPKEKSKPAALSGGPV